VFQQGCHDYRIERPRRKIGLLQIDISNQELHGRPEICKFPLDHCPSTGITIKKDNPFDPRRQIVDQFPIPATGIEHPGSQVLTDF
jgi:hypothetical protein